jgi:hypothetical protein
MVEGHRMRTIVQSHSVITFAQSSILRVVRHKKTDTQNFLRLLLQIGRKKEKTLLFL